MSQSARERILSSAIDLARTRGMAGTTVADLLEASGVARRSLYLNFTGGRDEALAAAGRAAGAEMTQLLTAVLAASRTVTEAAQRIIGGVRTQLEASDFTAGCPVMAAGLSGATLPEAKKAGGETFQSWRAALFARLSEDGIPAPRAETLASFIIATFEGAQALGVATGSTRYLDDTLVHLTEILDAEYQKLS